MPLIDGALGTELLRRGVALDPHTWDAGALRSHAHVIRAIHADYLRAGAEVITTATYQATADFDRAVRLAREAIAEVGLAARIAGSCGPRAALAGTGAEYRPDDASVADLVAFHLPRAEALLAAGVDLLAFETLPSVAEGEAAARVLERLGAAGWVSFSPAAPDHAPTVADGIALATGFNCDGPEALLARLARLPAGPPRVVYPNRRGHPIDWPAFATAARALGATWLGGCCGTTPQDTRALAEVW